MFQWLREYLEIRHEFRERQLEITKESIIPKVCESCETLRHQLEIANFEKKQLLDKLLKEPTPEPIVGQQIPVSVPRMVPWNVRKQMLEAEDRERAKLMRDAPKPMSEDIKEFEKELANAESKRESKS